MKFIASALAVFTLACAAVAVAQPRLQVQPQIQAPAPAPEASVPWQKHKNAEGDAPTQEFTASEPQAMNCELMRDAYEQNRPVVAGVANPARNCATLPNGAPAVADADRRPPRVRVIWNARTHRFDSVIDNVSTKYTMFLPDGAPVRATTSVGVDEASKTGASQSPPPADDDSDDDQ